MAAHPGKNLLLKIKTDRANYTSIAGMQSREIEFNARRIDITDSDSEEQWRELLFGSAIKSLRVSGEGVFRDTVADASIREAIFKNYVKSWQIVIPQFGVISGEFYITELAYAGDFDGEITWRLAFESTGKISFAAS